MLLRTLDAEGLYGFAYTRLIFGCCLLKRRRTRQEEGIIYGLRNEQSLSDYYWWQDQATVFCLGLRGAHNQDRSKSESEAKGQIRTRHIYDTQATTMDLNINQTEIPAQSSIIQKVTRWPSTNSWPRSGKRGGRTELPEPGESISESDECYGGRTLRDFCRNSTRPIRESQSHITTRSVSRQH